MREASYYHPEGLYLHCELCPKQCRIAPEKTGFCRVRRNTGGRLYAENYGQCTAYALDPIEKKPLYHFYPGGMIFSLGTWGCNFACGFCQNWEIAQGTPRTIELTPEMAVDAALRAGRNNVGIAYTYSEPGIWYEYIMDTAPLVREQGLKNVLVTNGFLSEKPLAALLPWIDAMNIDVKGFTPDFYRRICAGELTAVQRTVEQAAVRCHVEITTLLIPGLNDGEEEVAALSAWLAGISPEIPLHLSRYFPRHNFALPPTPLSTLEKARRIAGEYLSYVYIGNAEGEHVNTRCPACGLVVIDRIRGSARLDTEGHCKACGRKIAFQGDIMFGQ